MVGADDSARAWRIAVDKAPVCLVAMRLACRRDVIAICGLVADDFDERIAR